MGNTYRYDEKGVAFSNTRLYKIWGSMKGRCTTPSHTSFKNYGARGITVCQEWMDDFGAFREWAMATGYDETAPRGQYTLERKDTNGPYSPENCCWLTIQEQERNKRTNLPEWVPETVRKERKRRAQGVRPMEEYNRERAEQAKARLEWYKKARADHQGLSKRKLAETLGVSEGTIRRLEKKLEAEMW